MPRLRSVVAICARVMALVVSFALALALGAVLHLDLPATKRLVAQEVTSVLAGVLEGQVSLEHVGSLGLRGVSGVRVRARSPDGAQALFVDGLRVRLDALAVLGSAVRAGGVVVVVVDELSIDHADVALGTLADGRTMQIAAAFTPRPTPPGPPSPQGRGVRVLGPRVSVKHLWFHGAPPGAPALDGELSDFRASAEVDGAVVRARLEGVDIVSRGLPRALDPRGRLSGTVLVADAVEVDAALDGAVAEIPVSARAHLAGDRLDASLDAARVTAARLDALSGAGPFACDATLHAEAHGRLSELDLRAHVGACEAPVDVEAKITSGDGLLVRAKLGARHVDLHRVLERLPPSDLGVDARASLELRDGRWSVDATVDALPGVIAGVALPPGRVHATATDAGVTATARVEEPGVPVDVEAKLVMTAGAGTVDATLRADVADLSAIGRAPVRLRGSARVKSDVHVDLTTSALSGEVDVSARGLALQGHRVERLAMHARAGGTLARPEIDARVEAASLLVAGERLDAVASRAHVEIGQGAAILVAPSVAVRRGDSRVVASARRVDLASDRQSAVGVVVSGLGRDLRGEVARGRDGLRVKLDAPEIELAAVGRAASVDSLRGGKIAIAADVVLPPDGLARGIFRVGAEGLVLASARGRFAVDGAIDGRDLRLAVEATLDDVGVVEARTSDLRLGGRIDDPRAWRDATGLVDLRARADLSRLASLLPPGTLPVRVHGGEVRIEALASRASSGVAPRARVTAKTRGLDVEAAGMRSDDVDVVLGARVDVANDDSELVLRVVDGRGSVVALNAKALLPVLDDLTRDLSRLREDVLSAPLSVRLVVPERAGADLPAALRALVPVHGRFGLDLEVRGTAMEPTATLDVTVCDLVTPSFDVKTDTRLTGRFEGGVAVVHMVTKESRGRDLATLDARAELRVSDWIGARALAEPSWSANARLGLAALPLAAVPALRDQRVRGHLSGAVALDDLHRDARVRGKLVVEGLRVAGARYGEAVVRFASGAGRAEARAALSQSDGSFEARVGAGLRWGAAIAPSFDESVPVDARILARRFRLAALAPLLSPAITELDGRVDADASVHLAGDHPTMSGRVRLSEGTIGVAALGGTFRDARGTVSFEPDGTIRVHDVFLRDTEGELSASGAVKLDGVSLVSAEARVDVPPGHPVDLVLDGLPVGHVSASAKVTAQASPDRRAMSVVVDVPRLSVELPHSLKVGVQPIAAPERVRAGVRRDAMLVPLPLGAADVAPEAKADKPRDVALDVDVRLGQVRVTRGSQLAVALSGNPRARVSARTEVGGRIQLDGGKIDVQGKQFEIEQGFVTLRPDEPSDPLVVATASWMASDGTKVFAEFKGPVRSGKMTLRSEPARSKNEILALIMFGSAEALSTASSRGGAESNAGAQAAALFGGGDAAEGLTDSLDDLVGVKAHARIDSSSASNPAAQLELELSRDIVLDISHVLGTPPISEPDRNLATVKWRVAPRWTVETTFGDRGRGQVDGIWRLRY